MKKKLKDFHGFSIEILEKEIKHIYFRVYPSTQKIIISVPHSLDPKILNRAFFSRSEWLKKQIRKKVSGTPCLIKPYASGKKLLFKGRAYDFCVVFKQERPTVFFTDNKQIKLVVKPGTLGFEREKIIEAWYREQLKQYIDEQIVRWQPVLGVTIREFNVKKMKTRWGSCNINAARIWLNLALIQLDEVFIDYVIVHEMVHLLERKHNARFKGFMDVFIPDWRQLKKQLNRFRLEP